MDADTPVPTISSTSATATTSIASSSNSDDTSLNQHLLLSSDSRSTQSSTGAVVKSTFMKVNVSPTQVTKVKAKSCTPEPSLTKEEKKKEEEKSC